MEAQANIRFIAVIVELYGLFSEMCNDHQSLRNGTGRIFIKERAWT